MEGSNFHGVAKATILKPTTHLANAGELAANPFGDSEAALARLREEPGQSRRRMRGSSVV